MLKSFAQGALFAEQFGTDAPKLLALHGWQRSRHDFAGVLGSTSNQPELDALAVDLPGFGASPPPEQPWGTAEYAQALEPLLQDCKPGAVLVGHSFGGLVALRLAVAQPERIAALVLTGTPLYRADPSRARVPRAYRVLRGLAKAKIVSEARLEQARQRYGSTDYAQAHGVMREVLVRRLSEDYDRLLAELRVPCLLVWGERDTTVPVSVAERALQVLPTARLEVLEGVGHLLPTEAPAMLRSLIDPLLT